LNTLDGAEHRQRRRLLQRALDRRRVKRFHPAIASRVERAHAAWTEGTRLRLREVLDPLSLEVAGEVLLSVELEPIARELAAELRELMRSVPRWLPPLPGTRAARARVLVDARIAELIAERREVADGDDLVAALTADGLHDRVVRG